MLESGIPFAAHEACFERAFTAARQKEAAESARSDRRLRGMFGAVLAGVAAAAAFAIMFLWWGFGAIAALVGSMFGAAGLYGKFGGKNTPFRIAFVFFSTLVLLLATYAVCLYLQAPVADSVGGVVAGIADRLRTDVGFPRLIYPQSRHSRRPGRRRDGLQYFFLSAGQGARLFASSAAPDLRRISVC